MPDYLFISFKVFQERCSFLTAGEDANYYCGEGAFPAVSHYTYVFDNITGNWL